MKMKAKGANALTRTLYTGWTKVVIFIVLFVAIMVTTYPFGMLAAGYRLPPFFAPSPDGWIENTFDRFDAETTITRGWIYTGIVLFITLAYIVGFIWAWKNYAFARTLHTVE